MGLRRTAAVLAVMVVAPPAIGADVVDLTAHQKQVVEDSVRSALNDPESARFGGYKAVTLAGDEGPAAFVCGWVNARNKFGGYTGYAPFTGMLGTAKDGGGDVFVLIDVSGRDTINGKVTMQHCKQKGIDLDEVPQWQGSK